MKVYACTHARTHISSRSKGLLERAVKVLLWRHRGDFEGHGGHVHVAKRQSVDLVEPPGSGVM